MKTHNNIQSWKKTIEIERKNILKADNFIPAKRKTSDNRENMRDYQIKREFHLLNSFS